METLRFVRIWCGSSLVVLLVLVLAGPAGAQSRWGVDVQEIPRPPNIVLIIGDDHGWPYAGFMGDPIVETPNLDALAAEGTVFTHVLASASVCQPSLRTLLTGLHPERFSGEHARLRKLDRELTRGRAVFHLETLPRALARRDYRSFQGGKHWEGSFWMAGFDAGTTAIPDIPFQPDGADEFGRPSIAPLLDFLDEGDGSPFFLWVAPMLPHTPLDPPPEFQEIYEGRGLVPPAVLYYANITRLDSVVGRVVAELEARGLRDDTLILYVSDNGWEQAPDREHFLGSQLGGRRGKMSIYELGHRSPTIFSWPGRIPGGLRLDDLAGFEDLHATILDYAGAPLPPDRGGHSLRDRIEGRGEAARDRYFGVMRLLRVRESEAGTSAIVAPENAAYLRTRHWRYVAYLDRGEHELYRIDEDPLEDLDVAAAYPDVVAELDRELADRLSELAQPSQWTDLTGEIVRFAAPRPPGLTLLLQGEALDGSQVDYRAATAENGSFRFPNVPAGRYALRPLQGELAFAGALREAIPIDLDGALADRHVIAALVTAEPPPAGPTGRSEIAGWVETRRGRPAAGVPVELHGWTQQGSFVARAATGPDGLFVLDRLPAGFYFQWLQPAEGRAPLRAVLLGPDSRAESTTRIFPGWWRE